MDVIIRPATLQDIPALEILIPESVRGLQKHDYSVQQMEGALGTVFGVDLQLIEHSIGCPTPLANSRAGKEDRRQSSALRPHLTPKGYTKMSVITSALMTSRTASALLAAFALVNTAAAADPKTLSPERLARVGRVLQQYTDENRIPGAVALVLRDGKPVYEHAFGWSDKEANRRMTTDTIFRIASQTKAITSTAVMILVEEGKIGLNDPVGLFIPTFNQTTVAVTGTSGVKIVPASRAIAIRDLLTHTAGISYGREAQVAALYEAKALGPAAGNGWYTADKEEPICESMERLGTLPFVAQPGEAFVYGYNTDILGCIVEKASGIALDEFVRTRITEPLGMKDTRFFVAPADSKRLAAVYASGADGKAVRAADGSKGQGSYVDGPRKSFAGGAGLTSTAHDYARFLEMIRNGGTLGGTRILAPRTVELMTTNQSDTLHSKTGLGFGYGFETVDRYGASGLAGVGAFGWGGAYGTIYQVDPKSHLVIVFMEQLMPNTTDIREKVLTLVYQALID